MKDKWLRALTPFVAAAMLSVGSSSQTWATSLPPGGSVTPALVSGTGVAGTTAILADTGWLTANTPSGSGAIREIVVSGDTNNPNGGLDFIFRLQNTSSTSTNLAAELLPASRTLTRTL